MEKEDDLDESFQVEPKIEPEDLILPSPEPEDTSNFCDAILEPGDFLMGSGYLDNISELNNIESNGACASHPGISNANGFVVGGNTDLSCKSYQSIRWVRNKWSAWSKQKYESDQSGSFIPCTLDMLITDFQHLAPEYLTTFITEVKSEKGEELSPETLNHLTCILQMTIKNINNSFNVYSDMEFQPFRVALEERKNALKAMGVQRHTFNVGVITPEMETQLWKEGLLGDENPKKLLSTVYFLVSKYFGVRSRAQHRELTSIGPSSKIKLVQEGESEEHYIFEDSNTRGKLGRNVIKHMYRTNDKSIPCPVEIMKKYISLIPRNSHNFYNKPHPRPRPGFWYVDQPIGVNKFPFLLRDAAEKAGWDMAPTWSAHSLDPRIQSTSTNTNTTSAEKESPSFNFGFTESMYRTMLEESSPPPTQVGDNRKRVIGEEFLLDTQQVAPSVYKKRKLELSSEADINHNSSANIMGSISGGIDKLKGKVAIVTGASSGFGKAISILLAKQGVKVAMAARRLDKLKEVSDIITSEGGQCLAVQTDVTTLTDVQEMHRKVELALGPIDILVNNAGYMQYTEMKTQAFKEWDKTVDINIKGVNNCVGVALPGMIQRECGHIVNMSSDAGMRGFPGLAVYSGTKFYVEGLSQALRGEVAKHNIKITCIQPGNGATELLGHSTDMQAREKYDSTLSSKHEILSAQEVAQAVLYAVGQPAHVAINEVRIQPSAESF